MRGNKAECPRCGARPAFMSELYDARGIYCGSACEECMPDLTLEFRPEVLSDPNYECDEPVEEDE